MLKGTQKTKAFSTSIYLDSVGETTKSHMAAHGDETPTTTMTPPSTSPLHIWKTIPPTAPYLLKMAPTPLLSHTFSLLRPHPPSHFSKPRRPIHRSPLLHVPPYSLVSDDTITPLFPPHFLKPFSTSRLVCHSPSAICFLFGCSRNVRIK